MYSQSTFHNPTHTHARNHPQHPQHPAYKALPNVQKAKTLTTGGWLYSRHVRGGADENETDEHEVFLHALFILRDSVNILFKYGYILEPSLAKKISFLGSPSLLLLPRILAGEVGFD